MTNQEYKHGEEYGKSFYCNNCGYTFTWYFPFGVRAYQPQCPKCGVSPRHTGEVPWNMFTHPNIKEFQKDCMTRAAEDPSLDRFIFDIYKPEKKYHPAPPSKHPGDRYDGCGCPKPWKDGE